MAQVFQHVRPSRWLVVIVTSSLLLVISVLAFRGGSSSDQGKSQGNSQTVPRQEPSGILKYLPAGAEIGDERQNVITADIDNDGRKETIIFYFVKNKGAGVLALKPNGTNHTVMWQHFYGDSFGFAAPTGVQELNRNGRPQLLIYRLIGTSCPGVLEIYQFQSNKIEAITGSWAEKGQCHSAEIQDLDGDGLPEIVIKSRINGVNPDVYQWNKKRYVQRNAQFAWYYSDKLSELIASIHSREALPASARVIWCQQAVKIYQLQHNFGEAIQLCDFVLLILDDPNLTTPNSVIGPAATADERERILAFFEVEKIQGKGTVHQLLGELYKSTKDLISADKEYEEARTLAAKAKQMESELRRKYPIRLSSGK